MRCKNILDAAGQLVEVVRGAALVNSASVRRVPRSNRSLHSHPPQPPSPAGVPACRPLGSNSVYSVIAADHRPSLDKFSETQEPEKLETDTRVGV
ncbi:hypothetical protein E2C01_056755 [Portunus trituberculatus]|uniref:Uncharacterized protein n=1 Tax=Portunus trituberculatus TaxID=210409 RepID=A0A5B7GYL2_PORTR|nr:hypothetical protein [Portunus trituberculatus]